MPIGSLQPGDSILTADGRTQEVTGVFPQGGKPVFLVHLGGGRTAPATADHLWLACKNGLPPEVVTTEHLQQALEAGEEWSLPVMAAN